MQFVAPGTAETSFRDERCPLGPETEPHLARRSEAVDYFLCSWCGFQGTHKDLLDRILDESATAIASWGETLLSGSPFHRARMTAWARLFCRGGFDERTAALILAACGSYFNQPIAPAEALGLARLGRALEAQESERVAA